MTTTTTQPTAPTWTAEELLAVVLPGGKELPRAPTGFWEVPIHIAAAVDRCGSRSMLQKRWPAAYHAARRLGLMHLLPEAQNTKDFQGAPRKYTEQWLRETLTANPDIKRTPKLRAFNESAYQAIQGREWFRPVLAEFGVEFVPSRRGYWTEDRIKEAIAANGWTTREQMRETAQGQTLLSTCKARKLYHLLPAPLLPGRKRPAAEREAVQREKPRGKARVVINCWPFEGPATGVDAGEIAAVESAA